jgi:hypothetical protein
VTVKVGSLRLRKEPGQGGEAIRNLEKNEKLMILEEGKEELINGKKANGCRYIHRAMNRLVLRLLSRECEIMIFIHCRESVFPDGYRKKIRV